MTESKAESSTTVVNKWTLEELDLNEELISLESLVSDKQLLVEKLFSILPKKEIKELIPDNLKDMPFDILKDLCILDLDNNLLLDEEILSVLKENEKPQKSEVQTVEESKSPKESNNQEGKEEEEDPRQRERREILDKMDSQLKRSFMEKTGFSSEDLDIKREPLEPLESFVEDRRKLLETLLSLVTASDMNEIKPDNLKGLEMNELRSKCLPVLESLSLEEIMLCLTGKKDERSQVDVVKRKASSEASRKQSEKKEDDGSCGMKTKDKDKKKKDLRQKEEGNEARQDEKEGDSRGKTRTAADSLRRQKLKEAVRDNKEEEGNESSIEDDDNEKSNEEEGMNLCPEDTQREIEELEQKAQALRQLLKSLETKIGNERDSSPSSVDNRKAKKPRHSQQIPEVKETPVEPKDSKEMLTQDIPLPDPAAEDEVLVYSTRVREEDEDSLDRELMGEEDQHEEETVKTKRQEDDEVRAVVEDALNQG